MARFFSRFATAAACVAALSMAATPAMARGWGGHGGYRHHDHVSGGDVLAGVLILGGIAAIASAASKDRDRDDDYRGSEPYPYPDNRPEYRGSSSNYSGSSYGSGIDGAVNQCVGEIERGDERVAAVDNARRTADGWQISGQLDGGRNFNCAIDSDGRIRDVDLGDGYTYNEDASGQWDDDAYARARDDAGYPGE